MVDENAQEPLLATLDVAKWLGIAPRTLSTWAECNELPAIKVGRQWRFRRSDVISWLQRLGSAQKIAKTFRPKTHRPLQRLRRHTNFRKVGYSSYQQGEPSYET